jgi:hypothetical protein
MAILLLGLAIPWSLAAEKPQTARAKRLPFRCFTEVWNDPFKFGEPTLDRARASLTWVLVVKQDMPSARYEALLTDGDGVELATVTIKVTPKQPRWKAETRLHATVPLQGVEINNLCKVLIRKSS